MTPDTWTYNDLWNAIQRRVSEASPYAWIVDLKPLKPSVIYGDGGRTYEAGYTIGTDGTVTLAGPVEVRSQTVYWPAEETAFNFSTSTDATGRVRWSGLIFRGGRYAERPIREITEDDIAAIAASVPAGGIPIHLDHNENSFLAEALKRDGARLLRAWAVGSELHGEVEVPGWFAAGARELVKSVSVGLTDTLRGLRELSFVKFPRVTDAAVFTATPAFALFAQAHPDLAATIRQPAPPANTPPDTRKHRMTFKERMLSWFRGLPAEEREGLTEEQLTQFATNPAPHNPAPPTTQPPANRTTDAEAAVNARIAELEREFAATKPVIGSLTASQSADARRTAGLQFYETQLTAGRITPAEREQVLADYDMASMADGVTNFATTDEKSYVFKLTKRYEAMPAKFQFANRIAGHRPADDAPGKFGIFQDSDFDHAFGAKETTK